MRTTAAKAIVRGVLIAGVMLAASGCYYGPAPAPYAYDPYYGYYGYGYPYYGGYYYGGPSVSLGYYGGGWYGHEHWHGGGHWH